MFSKLCIFTQYLNAILFSTFSPFLLGGRPFRRRRFAAGQLGEEQYFTEFCFIFTVFMVEERLRYHLNYMVIRNNITDCFSKFRISITVTRPSKNCFTDFHFFLIPNFFIRAPISKIIRQIVPDNRTIQIISLFLFSCGKKMRYQQ